MKHAPEQPNDNAISEAIGFVLIFSLVIIGIGLVTMYGYPIMLQQQSSADMRIMEKNMIVLQNDIKSLSYKNVPYKETSLKVGGGYLSVFNSSKTPQNFTVSIDATEVYMFYPGELRYTSNDQGMVVTIENGAVIYRQYGSTGSTMLAQPRWFNDAPTGVSVVYFIGLNSTNILSQAGVGTVQLELTLSNYTEYSPLTGHTITVKYNPDPENDYSTAWKNYIDTSLGWPETFAGSNTYQLPASDTLVIKRYDVMVRNL